MNKLDTKIREYILSLDDNKDLPDEEIIQIILEEEIIWDQLEDDRRWWDEYFCVCKIGEMLIGYIQGRTTGDDSAYDKGYEFDPGTICEIEEYQVTVKKYREKK